MKKQDELFDEFKNFELTVHSRKLTFGTLAMAQTEVCYVTNNECGSDEEWISYKEDSC